MIRNGVCLSFLSALIDQIKGHEFKIALYRSDAQIGDMTTAYTSAGETIGQGYTFGGEVLKGFKVTQDIGSISLSWDKPNWKDATFSARYALIYISTLPGNPAVAVLEDFNPADLRGETSARNGVFSISIPEKLVTLALKRS